MPILAHYTFILPFRVFPCSLEPEKSVLIHDVTLRVHPRRHVFNLVSTTPRFHHPLCLRARPLGLTSLLGASSSCPSSGTPPLLAAPGLYFLSDEHCHTTLVLPSLASYVVVCTAHYRPAPVDLRAVHVVSSWYVKTFEASFSFDSTECSTTLTFTYPSPEPCLGIFSSRKRSLPTVAAMSTSGMTSGLPEFRIQDQELCGLAL